MTTSTWSSYTTTLKRSVDWSAVMASATARLAVSSLTPDIEPERSRTMARLTGGRVVRTSAAGAVMWPRMKRWLRPLARMKRRSVRMVTVGSVMTGPPRGVLGRSSRDGPPACSASGSTADGCAARHPWQGRSVPTGSGRRAWPSSDGTRRGARRAWGLGSGRGDGRHDRRGHGERLIASQHDGRRSGWWSGRRYVGFDVPERGAGGRRHGSVSADPLPRIDRM